MSSLNLMKRQSSVYKVRILREEKNSYSVKIGDEEVRAVLSGKIRHEAIVPSALPVVGDYVVCSYEPLNSLARIEEVLPRTSHLTRKVAGDAYSEQILASNLQTIFYITSLNMDLNLRRLERFMIMIRDGNCTPVILLSKADLADEETIQNALEQIETVAPNVAVHAISVHQSETMEVLQQYFLPEATIAFIGSSGVGKSTLTNFWLNREVQITQQISGDRDKGRHTTTSRSLFYLENGCAIIDTPGIREVQLWESDSVGLDDLFNDIKELQSSCRFSNCSHGDTLGCQVTEALNDGRLDEARLKSYLKLEREQAYIERKVNVASRREQKAVWKKRSRM